MALILDKFFRRRYNIYRVRIDMYKISISLGVCIGNKITNSTSYWQVLNHYGVTREDLKKLDLSYEELYKVYKTIQQHEQIRDFLKDLKKKITLAKK